MSASCDAPYSFKKFKSLRGENLELGPLQGEDSFALALALLHPDSWFCKTRGIDSPERFSSHCKTLLNKQDRGELLALSARLSKTGELVAMSVYQYPSVGFHKVEIGFTWIAQRWQRTFVNTEMKLLMLSHAFEEMQTKRVEFSVHPSNARSNAAMVRLGAKLEGRLRKWRFLPGDPPDDGDRNMYSVIDVEWPAIRARLSGRQP